MAHSAAGGVGFGAGAFRGLVSPSAKLIIICRGRHRRWSCSRHLLVYLIVTSDSPIPTVERAKWTTRLPVLPPFTTIYTRAYGCLLSILNTCSSPFVSCHDVLPALCSSEVG